MMKVFSSAVSPFSFPFSPVPAHYIVKMLVVRRLVRLSIGAPLPTTSGQKNTSQRANRSTVVSTLPLARRYAQQHRPKCAAEDGSTYGPLGCLITATLPLSRSRCRRFARRYAHNSVPAALRKTY
ncbi:hypothetical protein F442_13752 [Phytophthora nicotianae P10297]|uniref:Uncharacterized protein n=1 Tax=Phytophthora nicotianae P10297 TaxID=1317064 RepID=W2YVH3_PHYNI|nr:hypothetical protein F442_13752 [Phytophthora nicotianae P10297]